MFFDLYLKNGTVVTEDGVFRGSVAVSDGVIAQIAAGAPDLSAATTVDLRGQWLLPGLVDGHVHFNEPGMEAWERYRTGTMAAAAGGVTTILDMPLNSSPPTINIQELRRKRSTVHTEAVVDYAHWGGLVNNNLADMPDLHAEGVVGFKAFMTSSPDFPRVDDDLIYAGMQQARRNGNLVGIHCENEYVTSYLAQEFQAVGRKDLAAWPESRPPFQEAEAIRRALHWAHATGAALHVVHVSIREGMEAVAHAKQQGVKVSVETCPQYLMFDLEDYARIGPRAKCAPPIRNRVQVEALWESVLAGQVDSIGSDHSPCTAADKEIGYTDVWQAWGGISGVQTLLPGLLTEGVHKRGLPLTLLTRLTAANPARIFGLYPRKGVIRPGSDADLVVVDPERTWTLAADDLFYLNRHSAFEGYEFRGQVAQTYVRGVCVYDQGTIAVEPGFGQLLKRSAQAGWPLPAETRGYWAEANARRWTGGADRFGMDRYDLRDAETEREARRARSDARLAA